MAISILGSEIVVFGSSATPTPQDLTVPSGCTAAYVFWSGWANGIDHAVSAITLDSETPDFSDGDYVFTGNNNTDFVGVFCFLNPASGTRELDITIENALAGGPVCLVLYVSGDDGSGWRSLDIDGEAESNPAAGSVTSEVDDLIAVFQWGYSPGSEEPTPATGYTEQTSDKQQEMANILATKVATGDPSTYTSAGDTTYNGLLMIAIAPGAGGSVTGSGAISLDALTASGAGAVTRKGTGAITLDALTVAGAGTVGGEVSGSGSVVLAGPTVAGAGTVLFTPVVVVGTPNSTASNRITAITDIVSGNWLQASGAGSAGTASAPNGFVWVDDATFEFEPGETPTAFDVRASDDGGATWGAWATQRITALGAGALTLDAFTLAGSGGTGETGSGAITLDALTVSGAGIRTSKGAGAILLDVLTVAGAGVRTSKGTGAVLLEVVQVAGSGTVTRKGAGAIALDTLQVAGAGVRTSKGAAAIALDALTVAGAGDVFSGVGGSGSIQLPDIQVAGTGQRRANGSGAILLPVVQVDGAGAVHDNLTGAGAITIPEIEVSGSGKRGAVGSGSILLDAFRVSGTNIPPAPSDGADPFVIMEIDMRKRTQSMRYLR